VDHQRWQGDAGTRLGDREHRNLGNRSNRWASNLGDRGDRPNMGARECILCRYSGMFNREVKFGELQDPSGLRATVEVTLREPDQVLSIRLKHKVTAEQIRAQTFGSPDNSAALKLGRMAVAALGRSCGSREVANNVELIVVAALKEGGT
jgi:hypothetical protein